MRYRNIMKKSLVVLFTCFLTIVAKADGIRFDTKLSWAAIKEKAKKENKYILLDCQTTWCGYCKKMDQEVFPDEKVGAFFNANFISVSVQFDQKPKQDNEYVKSWYKDAEQIGKDYPITGYPTFLIFAPDGNLVHRIVGYLPADKFLVAGQNALKPEGQYFTLVKQLDAGQKSTAFLKNFISVAQEADFPKVAAKAFNDYFPTIKDPFTKDNLTLIAENTQSTRDKGFELYLNNSAKVDSVLGGGTTQKMLRKVMMGEIGDALSANIAANTDSMLLDFRAKRPDIDIDKQVAELKLQKIAYSNKANQNEQYLQLAKKYLDKYGADISADMLEGLSRNAYRIYNDEASLRTALGWCKRAVDMTKEKDRNAVWTYSLLLYKLGEKQDAVTWMEKALGSLPEEVRKDYQPMLDKMKKGENIQEDKS